MQDKTGKSRISSLSPKSSVIRHLIFFTRCITINSVSYTYDIYLTYKVTEEFIMAEKGVTTITLKKINKKRSTSIFIMNGRLPSCRSYGIWKWDCQQSVRISTPWKQKA